MPQAGDSYVNSGVEVFSNHMLLTLLNAWLYGSNGDGYCLPFFTTTRVYDADGNLSACHTRRGALTMAVSMAYERPGSVWRMTRQALYVDDGTGHPATAPPAGVPPPPDIGGELDYVGFRECVYSGTEAVLAAVTFTPA